MGLASKLIAGEKVECPKCKKGYYQPVFRDIPIEECKKFSCSHCGDEITLLKKWRGE